MIDELLPEIEKIAEEAFEDVFEELKKESQPDLIRLKELANYIVNTYKPARDNSVFYNNEGEQIERFKDVLSTKRNIFSARFSNKDMSFLSQEWNRKKYDVWAQYKFEEIEKIREESINKVFDFQKLCNQVLGTQIIMAYVYRTKNGEVQLLQINEKEHFRNLNFANNKASLSLDTDKIKAMKRLYMRNTYVDVNNLNITYNEVIVRANISKQVSNKIIIMWKDNNNWKSQSIHKLGDLDEMYVHFYVSKNSKMPNFKSPLNIEKAVGQYILYGIKLVDNAQGFMGQEDVKINENNFIGAKGKGASSTSFNLAVEAAKGIIKSNPTTLLEAKEVLQKVMNTSSSFKGSGVLNKRDKQELVKNLSNELKKERKLTIEGIKEHLKNTNFNIT